MDYENHREFISTALMSPLEELENLLKDQKIDKPQELILREILVAASAGDLTVFWKLVDYVIGKTGDK